MDWKTPEPSTRCVGGRPSSRTTSTRSGRIWSFWRYGIHAEVKKTRFGLMRRTRYVFWPPKIRMDHHAASTTSPASSPCVSWNMNTGLRKSETTGGRMNPADMSSLTSAVPVFPRRSTCGHCSTASRRTCNPCAGWCHSGLIPHVCFRLSNSPTCPRSPRKALESRSGGSCFFVCGF